MFRVTLAALLAPRVEGAIWAFRSFFIFSSSISMTSACAIDGLRPHPADAASWHSGQIGCDRSPEFARIRVSPAISWACLHVTDLALKKAVGGKSGVWLG